MTNFDDIYRHRAEDYDALVACEDYTGQLLRTLRGLVTLSGARVVETGAGTGRLTRLLAPHVAAMQVFDGYAPMLQLAQRKLNEEGFGHLEFAVALHERLPAGDGVADLGLAGWTFGHAVGWFPEDWPARIDAYVQELARTVKSGGALIIIETLGTGVEVPAPPNPQLGAYYQRLEQVHGFRREAIRTDYRFPDLATAERLVRFFFGDARGDRVREEQLLLLPECTGVWHRVR